MCWTCSKFLLSLKINTPHHRAADLPCFTVKNKRHSNLCHSLTRKTDEGGVNSVGQMKILRTVVDEYELIPELFMIHGLIFKHLHIW